MVSVLASSAIARGFDPRSGQTKDYAICISLHAALRKKSKDWLARNQNNMSEWSDMSTRGLLCQWASKTGCFEVFFVGFVFLIFLVFRLVLLCVFAFWVPCCDVRYEIRIQTMFGSSLLPVICRRAYVVCTLCVYACIFAHSGVQHILCCVFVLFFFVLCTLCCHVFWIVLSWLPLR